jgi:hypothetical protein
MSSDLSVRLTRPINIVELVQEVVTVTRELLNVASIPLLKVFRLESGARYPVTSGIIEHHGQGFVVKIEGFDEAVSITVIEIPHDSMILANESGLWAGVAVAAMRTPLEFALAASVVVALARLSNTTIVDDGLVWTPFLEQSPDDFVKKVMVHEQYSDPRVAADCMYLKRPLGRIIDGVDG